MKHLLILLFAFGFLACAKDPATKTIDLEAIQAKLKADPEVSKARGLFFEHAKIVGVLSPEEMKQITEQLLECGVNMRKSDLQVVESCLKNIPYGTEFVKGEAYYREYYDLKKVIKQRYPDFAALDNKAQAGLLLYESTKFAEEFLSSVQQKKENEK